MQVNPISLSVFLLGIFLGIIAFYAWQHRETRGSRIFGLFMGLITLYVLGYSMELSSVNLKTMLFWSTVEYIGIFSFPNIFLLFVFQYTGRDRWIAKRNIYLLFIIPIILLFFKITDGSLHLVYSTTWVDTTGLIPMLGFTRGPIYLLASYNAFPVIMGVVLLLKQQKKNQKLYRNQTNIILISVIPPLLVFIFYLIGFQPFPRLKYLDLNAFSYPLWGMGFYWAAYRYKLFQLAPIARETLIEHLSDGVLVFDDQNRLVDSNPMAQKMMGWEQSPIGQDVCQLIANWKELFDACPALGMEETVKSEMQHRIDDRTFYFDLDITPLKDKTRVTVGKLILIHDITDRKQLEEKQMEMTLIDELTGLNNRRGFLVLAAQFIQMVNRMNINAAVIFLDLDQMKTINDTFGHAEGDRALFDAANLLRSTIRASDILARYGGDEFVALVMETESKGSDAMLKRLDKKFAEFNSQENRKYPMTLSYGVARYNSAQPESLDELIEKADRAMYEQKQAKKQVKAVN